MSILVIEIFSGAEGENRSQVSLRNLETPPRIAQKWRYVPVFDSLT